MTRALLIGKEPAAELGYSYVTEPPYDAVVIGSLTLSQLLRFREERVLSALAEGKPVVMDFWAPWCGPCKMVGPIIDELATEYEGKVIIGKCDVDENGDVAAEYGIRNIPTVLFFKNGELVDKQVGSAPKSAYVAKIEAIL